VSRTLEKGPNAIYFAADGTEGVYHYLGGITEFLQICDRAEKRIKPVVPRDEAMRFARAKAMVKK